MTVRRVVTDIITLNFSSELYLVARLSKMQSRLPKVIYLTRTTEAL